MKKVLITGGRGFLGSRFTEAHIDRYEILATGSKELNILNHKHIDDCFSRFRPDYVIHAAAIPLSGYCEDNPDECYEVNVRGTLNIAEACKKWESKMIFMSTEQVFNGNSNRGPYSESDNASPDTVYGKNKLEAENLISEVLSDLVILRLTWLFGVPEKNKPVVSNILWDTFTAVRENRTIVVSDNEYRGLTFVDELVEQFPGLIDLPPGIYHAGSENNYSRYEIVCFILKELGLESRISELVHNDLEKYRDNPRDIRLNTDRLKKEGIRFSQSTEALSNCIRKYKL